MACNCMGKAPDCKCRARCRCGCTCDSIQRDIEEALKAMRQVDEAIEQVDAALQTMNDMEQIRPFIK